MKQRAAMAALLLVGVVTVGSCSDGQVSYGGQNDKVDLAVVFKATTPDQRISDFIDDSLSQPASDGRPGVEHRPGIQGITADYSKQAIYVTFESSASQSDQAAVIRTAKSSPLVALVRQDVAPSAIPD